MNNARKNFALRSLAVSAIAALAMSTANAQIIIHKPRLIVRPVVVAPVVAAPVAVAPVAVAPVVVAPVAVAPVTVAPVVVAPVAVAPAAVVAPVVVAPVYVPTCRLVAVPVVNAFTGLTYMVTRRVCN